MLDALQPFHPRMVHFPIALSLVGVLFVALGMLRSRERWVSYGQLSLLLGWLGVMAAVVTGLIDQSRAGQDPAIVATINQHITAGVALLVVLGLALYWPLRHKRLTYSSARWGYLVLLALVVLLVMVEGWLGGKLVYHFHVGIR